MAASASFGEFAYQSVLTVGGYAGATTLTNFPVLVRISSEQIVGFSYGQLRDDHLDMRFTSLDGATVYPHEVDTWNADGESLVWVKVPELAGAATQFLFKYGDSAYATPADATAVWNGAAGGHYAGVWHFGEEIDAAAAPKAVSADAARHDGTGSMDAKLWNSGSSRAAEATSTNGVIGTARVNQLANDGYKNGFMVPSTDTLKIGSHFTASMWVKCCTETMAGYRLLTHKTSWNAVGGWEVNFEGGSVLNLLARGNDGTSVYKIGDVPDCRTDWVHLVAVYDGTTATLYGNGVSLLSGSLTEVQDVSNDFYIGCEGGHGNPFPGCFDEVRILGASASADWVKAEYDAVHEVSFVTASKAAPTHNALVVESSSAEYSEVSPAWGVHTGYADGETVVCTAPAAPTVVSEDLLVACTGWTLYNADGSVAGSGTGLVCNYVYHDGPTKRLVWHYAEKAAFAYRSVLTVSGYAGTETLTNFPTLVRLSSASIPGFDYTALRADHKDIRFTSMDGAVTYPYEIDTWNPSGASLVWVKLPALAGQTTQFRLEYGDAYWAHGASPSEVWKGAAASDPYYAGVWHFGETIAAASAATAKSVDSSCHDASLAMDMTPQTNGNGAQMVSTSGIVGNARVNATVSNSQNGLVVPNYDAFAIGDAFTASVWINGCDTGSFGSIRVFQRKQGWQNTDGWEFSFASSKNAILARGADGYQYATATPLPDFMGSWTLFTVVFSGNSAKIYANGVRVDDGHEIVAATDNGKVLMLGSEPGRGQAFPGSFDEARLWSGVATADRVKASYETVANASFLTATAVAPIEDALVVRSSSGEYGTVTPAYGIHTDYEDGEIVHCEAPAGTIVVSDTLRVSCSGWTLYGEGADGQKVVLDSATTNAYDYVYHDGPSRWLEWHFAENAALTLSSDVGCTFRVNGETVAGGQHFIPKGTVTVEPIVPAGYEFLRWEGDLANTQLDVFAMQTLDFEEAKALKAIFFAVDAEHVGTTVTWQGMSGGSWHDAVNWGGAVPGPGDTVSLADCGTVVVTGAVPRLASLTVGNGATLVVSNWYSRVSADVLTVEQGGTVGTFGYLLNDDGKNRVWLAGGTLAVAAGGRIVADGSGYAGTNGPCWTAAVTRKPYDPNNGRNVMPFGGAYGGRQGFRQGMQLSGNYSWKTTFVAPEPYGSAEWPFDLGSGGGSFVRSGGGAVYLDFTGSVTVDGTVSANASEAGYANFPSYESNGNAAEGMWNYMNTSYGSGGGIVIRCGSIAGSGAVQANSGRYVATRNGLGGGSGGRIAVHYDETAQTSATCTVRFEARGGSTWNYNVHDPYLLGDPGTLWFTDNGFLESYKATGYRFAGVWSGPAAAEVTVLEFDGDALFDGSGLVLPALRSLTVGGNLSLLGDDTTKPAIAGVNALKLTDCDVEVAGDILVKGARLELEGGSLAVSGNLTLANLRNSLVNGGGELLVVARATNETRTVGALVTVGGRLTVEKNAVVWPQICQTDGAYVKFAVKNLTVDAGGQICADNRGWGLNAGPGAGYAQYGASHGGRGGSYSSNLQWVSNPYGSEMYPLEAGSGGNERDDAGVICIEASGRIRIDGAVHADAQSANANYLRHDYTTGAAGGGVFLSAKSVDGAGTVSANGGGDGLACGDYGMGSGGRIAIWTTRAVTDAFKSRVTVTGGTCKSAVQLLPEDGTVYYGTLEGPGFMLIVQ